MNKNGFENRLLNVGFCKLLITNFNTASFSAAHVNRNLFFIHYSA